VFLVLQLQARKQVIDKSQSTPFFFATMYQRALLFAALAAAVRAQQAGTQKTETHPSLTWQKCTAAGSCTEQSGSVVIDANWRWTHSVDGTNNCYTGNTVRYLAPNAVCIQIDKLTL
jgi:hypothetical protein